MTHEPAPNTNGTAIAQPGPPQLMARLQKAKHRVVVLGGGFAGVYTAHHLTQMLGSRTDVHVELLSEENYFVFQPLLPEVAAGGVSPTHVVNPVREMVPRAQFRWSKVQRVDVENKVVYASQGEGKELVGIPYDHLVFALGKVSNFSSMPGVAEHALAMKDLSDAFKLRNHVYRCLELADVEDDPAEKAALLTFVVAGGGFSGVETVGELSEMLHKVKKNFKNIDAKEIRLILVHSRDTLLAEMPPALGKAATEILKKRGVEIIINARTKAASRYAVYLSTGQRLETRTFICTVGNAPNPVCKEILSVPGFVEGKSGGRGVGVFQTDLQLQCTGQTHYWAVGDCAGVPMPGKPDEICPATAQFAIRQGKVCAQNILAAIDNRPDRRREFEFKGLGTLASLGNRSAVADMMGVQLKGFVAWFAWRTIYLSKLPGMIRRLRVTVDWTLDLFFPRDITQLQPETPPQLRVEHYEPGELIIGRHEIGRELFVIQKGTVEVKEPDGAVVATLSDGEVFGEKALLTDAPRTANVVAKTPVDVLVMTRAGFKALVGQLQPLEDYFTGLMKQRYPQLVPDDARVSALVATATLAAQRRSSSSSSSSSSSLIAVGTTVPDVAALDQDGVRRDLRSWRGRPVVVFFYPKDGSPGCTSEVCAFRDAWAAYEKAGVVVVGVSTDEVAAHARFAGEHRLPFSLLADPDGSVCRAFGVDVSEGRAARVTVLVDARGAVRHRFADVDPAVHAREVLAILQHDAATRLVGVPA